MKKRSSAFRRVFILSLISTLVLALLSVSGAQASEARAQDPQASGEASEVKSASVGSDFSALTLYGGVGTPTALPEIIRARDLSLFSYGLLAVAYSKTLTREPVQLAWELESNLAFHFEGSWALAGAWVGRWMTPPWRTRKFVSTFAIGNGLSYANRPPELELRELARTARLLYYLMFELTLARDDWAPWEAVVRIHHRSGIFGIFSDVTGGSDYVCLGIKRRF